MTESAASAKLAALAAINASAPTLVSTHAAS
jgi:hypothetical protein